MLGPYDAPVGRALRYRLEFETTTHAHAKRADRRDRMRHRVVGLVELSILHRDQVGVVVAFRMDRPEVVVEVPGGILCTSISDQLAEDLAVGARIALSSTGELRGFEFVADSDPASRNLVRSLWEELRFVTSGRESTPWTALEPGLHTPFAVTYAWRAGSGEHGDSDLRSLERRMQGGVPGLAEESAVARSRHVVDRVGLGVASFSADLGWWSSIESRSKRDVDAGLLEAHQEVALACTLVACEDGRSTLDERAVAGIRWAPVSGGEDAREAAENEQRARHATRLANRAPGALVEALLALAVAGEGFDHGLLQACTDLRWKLRLSPDAVSLVERVLRTSTLSARQRTLLLDVVAEAGTTACQELLANLCCDPRQSPELRRDVLRATFALQRPGERVLGALVGVAGAHSEEADAAAIALLALGTALRRADGGGDRIQRLAALEGVARTRGLLVPFLEALGNLGDPATPVLVRRHVCSEDPAVRAASASALRRVATPEAEQALARLLHEDSVAGVRMRAGEVLAARATAGAAAELTRFLAAEPVEEVRIAVVRALGVRPETRAGAIEALRACLGSERSERVLALAQERLADLERSATESRIPAARR